MKRALLVSFGIAVFSLILYAFCIAPSVYWEDSGEFLVTAKNLGVAHPPGHPFYIVLSHVFATAGSSLNTTISINFFSVFCAFLSVFFLCFTFFSLADKFFNGVDKRSIVTAVISSGLLFAFSKTFWYYTEIAEVYTLHMLFVILLFLAIFLFYKVEKRFIFLFSYLFGLSLSNNITVIYLLPAFLIFIFLKRRRLNRKIILVSLLLFFLGISFYLYVPIRARFNPVFNWGGASSLKSFTSLFFAQEFSRGFLTHIYTERSIFPFVLNFIKELSYWGIIPFLWGMVVCFKKDKVLVSLSPLFLNYKRNCRKGDYDAFNYGNALQKWISKDGIFLTENTNDFFILFYLKEFYPGCDFDVLYLPLFKVDWYRTLLMSEGFQWKGELTPFSLLEGTKRICYYTPGAGISLPVQYLIPWGPVFKFVEREHRFFSPIENFKLPEPEDQKGKKRYAILFSRFGEYYFKQKAYILSINAYEKAKKYAPYNRYVYYNLSILYSKIGDLEHSIENKKISDRLKKNFLKKILDKHPFLH
ncbi:MAG: hypothetical protein B5M53_12375 [Candidatus Cloacimonas sp. 4484_209]|nr:MAG: hypothetical protein B5M53_12375 [Candidatus Cloacimonas sp. 4484_209]